MEYVEPQQEEEEEEEEEEVVVEQVKVYHIYFTLQLFLLFPTIIFFIFSIINQANQQANKCEEPYIE